MGLEEEMDEIVPGLLSGYHVVLRSDSVFFGVPNLLGADAAPLKEERSCSRGGGKTDG